MRPQGLQTKIFLDSGDPAETRNARNLLGFLDGQTTNPTLIAKNPEVQKRLAVGKKFTKQEINTFYQETVTEISAILPEGSVSIEVYADDATSADAMVTQGQDMFAWIRNAHIKYPTTPAGLVAAEQSVQAGIRVNMTLCFSQEQAAAVYAATKQAGTPSLPGFANVFVSPFIGRLDDTGQSGMGLMSNIIRMYQNGDGHVAVLAASVRNLNHFLYALQLQSDSITTPYSVLQEWVDQGMPLPDDQFSFDSGSLTIPPLTELDLTKPWQDFAITHPLTDAGIERFAKDWNALVTQ